MQRMAIAVHWIRLLSARVGKTMMGQLPMTVLVVGGLGKYEAGAQKLANVMIGETLADTKALNQLVVANWGFGLGKEKKNALLYIWSVVVALVAAWQGEALYLELRCLKLRCQNIVLRFEGRVLRLKLLKLRLVARRRRNLFQ